jgi:hypothetical protein
LGASLVVDRLGTDFLFLPSHAEAIGQTKDRVNR